jgi:putative intracellular protease/amidase
MHSVAIILSTCGYHWEELIDAYEVFKNANWRIYFYTINGNQPTAEPKSLEQHFFLSFIGLGLRRSFSPQSALGLELQRDLLSSTFAIDRMDLNKIDAINIVGGYGTLFDLAINQEVHRKLVAAYEQTKFITAIGHGASSLALAKVRGSSLIKNKRIIGFLDVFDRLLGRLGLIDARYLPLPIHMEQLIREKGAMISRFDYLISLINPGYFIVDLPFIIGAGPKSAKRVAYKLVVLQALRDALSHN